MAAYIGRIQDANSNDVYPQTKSEAVIGLDDKIKGATSDTGNVMTGISFLNGAYDYGKKASGNPYSFYRVVTAGDVDIVMLSLDVSRNKATASPVVYGTIPASVALKGTNNFAASPNGVQVRFTENTFRIAQTGELPIDARVQLRVTWIKNHK